MSHESESDESEVEAHPDDAATKYAYQIYVRISARLLRNMYCLIINSRFGSKLLAVPLPRFPPACGGLYVVYVCVPCQYGSICNMQ